MCENKMRQVTKVVLLKSVNISKAMMQNDRVLSFHFLLRSVVVIHDADVEALSAWDLGRLRTRRLVKSRRKLPD